MFFQDLWHHCDEAHLSEGPIPSRECPGHSPMVSTEEGNGAMSPESFAVFTRPVDLPET